MFQIVNDSQQTQSVILETNMTVTLPAGAISPPLSEDHRLFFEGLWWAKILESEGKETTIESIGPIKLESSESQTIIGGK